MAAGKNGKLLHERITMKKLLVSVKNADEAMLALSCGADFIDLKDPSVGALGALDIKETQHIVHMVGGRVLISATVGERHTMPDDMMDAITQRISAGVDIIKISVADMMHHGDFIEKISDKFSKKTKLVAVFFADTGMDFDLLPQLSSAGFYGVMLDTQNKQNGLLQVKSINDLQRFVVCCEVNRLKSGLAGSLQLQDIDVLEEINATYIGFRGGLCDNCKRDDRLSRIKVEFAKQLLHKHNSYGLVA